MKNTWVISIHSAAGYPCGTVEAKTRKSAVEVAHDRMPWLSRAEVNRMASKKKEA